MTYFKASKINPRYVKNKLKARLANVSSSYRSEIIAASIGYNSNISFKQANTANIHPMVCYYSDRKAAERANKLGVFIQDNELTALFVQDELPDPMWRITLPHTNLIRDKHFDYCDANNLPYLYIIQNRKYCLLHWDAITIDYEKRWNLTEPEKGLALKEIDDAFVKVWDKSDVRSPYARRQHYTGSILTGTGHNLTLNEAEEIAASIYNTQFSRRV